MKKNKLFSLAIIFLSFFFISSGIKNNQIKQCSCITATSGNNDKISPDCTFNGFKLYGKIKFVEHFPDIKIQIVEHFPDLKVQLVEHFPDKCGKWQIVEHFPDLKVQIVEHFPDIKSKVYRTFSRNSLKKFTLNIFKLVEINKIKNHIIKIIYL